MIKSLFGTLLWMAMFWSQFVQAAIAPDSAPLLGKLKIYFANDLTLDNPGENEIGEQARFLFDHGQRINTRMNRLPSSQFFCAFLVGYDDAAFLEAIQTKTYPTLVIKKGTTVFLTDTSDLTALADNNPINVQSVHFLVDPSTIGGATMVGGAMLGRQDGKESDNRLLSIDCRGDQLTVGSLKRAFAPFIDSVYSK